MVQSLCQATNPLGKSIDYLQVYPLHILVLLHSSTLVPCFILNRGLASDAKEEQCIDRISHHRIQGFRKEGWYKMKKGVYDRWAGG
jgi:hypothetical protein